MCGILGVIDCRQPINRPVFEHALNVMIKRGPDHEGLWFSSSDNVALGHRRLSIIDISHDANQPMVSEDGRFVIVFNGEIYNYKELKRELLPPDGGWKTKSDTEVLLVAYRQWGQEMLPKLRGMFAFAIWDNLESCLFAARDRLGVKPFYYSCHSGFFAWASRPRPLKKVAREKAGWIDIQAIRFYLESGYIPAPWSLYSGIKKLLPGCFLRWDSNKGHKIERWWDPIDFILDNKREHKSEEQLISELEVLIDQSVAYRMVSDVPIGAFLSGGIDSSIVVAAMQRQSSAPIKTFTIGFADKDHDESKSAKLVADYLGTEHHSLVLNDDDLLALLPSFADAYDEPFSDSAAFPTMAVSKLASKHVKVVLSGDGGDELFGGYHYYQLAKVLGCAYGFPKSIRKSIASLLYSSPYHRGKLLGSAISEPNLISAISFSRSILKDFSHPLAVDSLEKTKAISSIIDVSLDRISTGFKGGEQAAMLDLLFTLPDDYLQKIDLATMAYSVEGREPLLDHSLVQWSLGLPWHYKIQKGLGKYLLRRCAYRRIPQKLLDRPKQGFSMPLARWLRGPLREWMGDRLSSSKLYEHLPLNREVVQQIEAMHLSGKRNAQPILWALVILADFIERDLH